MIGKIPTWWENSDRGNRKTAGKNSAMVGNFPQWEKKVFRCMDHLVLRHPSYMRGFTYPFSLSVVLPSEEETEALMKKENDGTDPWMPLYF
jgi:hypothetical protein